MTRGSAARAIWGKPSPTAAAVAPRSNVLRRIVVICAPPFLRRPPGGPASRHFLVPAVDDRVPVLVCGVPVKYQDLLGPVAIEWDQRFQLVGDRGGPTRRCNVKTLDAFLLDVRSQQKVDPFVALGRRLDVDLRTL